MFRKWLPLVPLTAAALALPVAAAPAQAATPPGIVMYNVAATGPAQYVLVADSTAAEAMIIVGNTVYSSLPIKMDRSAAATCSAPTQVPLFGSTVYATTCTPAGVPNWIVGLAGGNDTFVSSANGSVSVSGNGGNDTMTVGSSNASVDAYGGAGSDTITLGNAVGHARANGDAGADTLTANKTGSILNGGGGADTFWAAGNGATDKIDCGNTGQSANQDGAKDIVHRDAGVDRLSNCEYDFKDSATH